MIKIDFPFIADVKHLDEVANTHSLVKVIPGSNPQLGYSFLIPKNWKSAQELRPQEHKIGALIRIGLFSESSESPPAVIQVTMTPMPFEINLMDWVPFQFHRFDTRLLSINLVEHSHGIVVDAGGSISTPGKNTHIVRQVSFADKGRIFSISGICDETRYDQLKRDLSIAASSFRLLAPAQPSSLEQAKWIVTEGCQNRMRVAFPQSWTARSVDEDIENKCGLDIVLPNEEETELLSYLRLKFEDGIHHSELPYDAFLATCDREIKEKAIHRREPWQESSDWSDRLSLEHMPTKVFSASVEINNQTSLLSCSISHTSRFTSIATLIYPSKEKDTALWMRSRRALEIATMHTEVLE